MLNSIKSTFRQYATFYGRETRRTFLEFFFFQVIISFMVAVIVIVCWIAAGLTINEANSSQNLDDTAWLGATIWGLLSLGLLGLYSLFQIASIVPTLALQARRLHDANFSAWWLLLHLLPFGSVALFIMNCFHSVNGESIYENEGRPRGRASITRTTSTSSTTSDEW